MPFIYDAHENKTHVAALIHKLIHGNTLLYDSILRGITELDALLYSDETRNTILSKLIDTPIANYLHSADQTRMHVYRFSIKGSNAPEIIKYYLQNKYTDVGLEFPDAYLSDWDTSILINPQLPSDQFTILFEALIPIIQKHLIHISNTLASLKHFHEFIESRIELANEVMTYLPEYSAFTKYPLVFKKEKQSFVTIYDSTKNDPYVIEYVQSLGQSGKGLYVSSTRDGGKKPSDNVTPPKFYLGRLLLSVLASKTAYIPVELLDISINYQNEDLQFSWESYSEYHIQYDVYNFRVMSATSMYFDLTKCIMNVNSSSVNQTKRKKNPARKKRIQYILDTLIIPYSNANTIIHNNLEKHTHSQTTVGNLRRKMNITRKKRRIYYYPDVDPYYDYDPYD